MKGEGFGGVLSKSESDTGVGEKRSLSIIFPSHPEILHKTQVLDYEGEHCVQRQSLLGHLLDVLKVSWVQTISFFRE